MSLVFHEVNGITVEYVLTAPQPHPSPCVRQHQVHLQVDTNVIISRAQPHPRYQIHETCAKRWFGFQPVGKHEPSITTQTL